MGTNIHPADELSLVREELRRLKAREAELRAGFLTGDLPRVGSIAQVGLKVQRRRVLQRNALPPSIQNDARYWKLAESHVVVVEDRDIDWVEDEVDDCPVIEPFDA